MIVNGEKVTLDKVAEWATTAHEKNVEGIAVAKLTGYDVRPDASVPMKDIVFLAHPDLIEQADELVERWKSETTE